MKQHLYIIFYTHLSSLENIGSDKVVSLPTVHIPTMVTVVTNSAGAAMEKKRSEASSTLQSMEAYGGYLQRLGGILLLFLPTPLT